MRIATEERYDPAAVGAPRSVLGTMRYEHLHRYGSCLELAAGKDVLDVACGEGYGTALLASRAASVVGVDLDERVVERARSAYGAANVRFECGDCAALPLGDATVDLVVSFETLEHTAAHDEMLAEIRRVLRPGGQLVISSPNKAVYSDASGYANAYHVRELYHDELVELLRRYFPSVSVHAQRLAAASFIVPLGERSSDALPLLGGDDRGIERGLPPPERPMYFLAVCGDGDAGTALASAFTDPADDLLDALRTELDALRAEHGRTVVALEASKAEVERLGRRAGAAARGIREHRERLDDQHREMIALAQRWRDAADALLRLSKTAAVLRDQAALGAVPDPRRDDAARTSARAIQALIGVRDTLADQLKVLCDGAAAPRPHG